MRVKYKARIAENISAPAESKDSPKQETKAPEAPEPVADENEPKVREESPESEALAPAEDTAQTDESSEKPVQETEEKQGESVLRDVLGAKPMDKD